MVEKTPEEEGRELQQRLEEDLGVFAPRLGTYPARVKWNTFYVWIGAMVFNADSFVDDGSGAFTVRGLVVTAICAAFAFGYERLYWRAVTKARAEEFEREAIRAANRAIKLAADA